MSKRRTNPDFLNGVPELVVLQLLARRPMHGYELVQAIHRSSGQVLTFGEGCIYPVLHKLEQEKFLAARTEVVSGRGRVVYRVTRQGSRRLEHSAADWRRVAEAVLRVLQGGSHEAPALV